MSGLSAVGSASHTALTALNRLGDQLDQIAQNVAAGSDATDLASSLSELPKVGIEFQANLFVLQKVQEMTQDLILQPRR